MPTSGPIPRPSFRESKYSQSQFGKSSFQSLGRAGPAPGNTSATAARRERDRANKPALVPSETTVGRMR